MNYNPQDLDAVPMLGVSETRAADRRRMGEMVRRLAESHGATCTIEADGASVRAAIEAPGGLRGRAEFWARRGRLQRPNVFVVPWNVPPETPARLNPSVFGDVNRVHGQKATTVAHSFGALYEHLHQVLGAAKAGTAYVVAEVVA